MLYNILRWIYRSHSTVSAIPPLMFQSITKSSVLVGTGRDRSYNCQLRTDCSLTHTFCLTHCKNVRVVFTPSLVISVASHKHPVRIRAFTLTTNSLLVGNTQPPCIYTSLANNYVAIVKGTSQSLTGCL